MVKYKLAEARSRKANTLNQESGGVKHEKVKEDNLKVKSEAESRSLASLGLARVCSLNVHHVIVTLDQNRTQRTPLDICLCGIRLLSSSYLPGSHVHTFRIESNPLCKRGSRLTYPNGALSRRRVSVSTQVLSGQPHLT